MTSNPFLDILRDYERGSSGASLPGAGDPFGDILSEAGEITKRKKAEEQEKILGPSEQTQFIIPADKEAVDEPNPTPPKPPVYEDARPPVVRMLGQAARAGREFLGGLGSGIGRSLPEMAAGATEAVAEQVRSGFGLSGVEGEFNRAVSERAGLPPQVDPRIAQREAAAGLLEGVAKPIRSLAELTPEYQPEVPTLGAIQSPEDVPAFVAGQLGQGISTVLPMVAASAAGGVPAAVIVSYGLNSGDVFNELIDNGIPAKEASDLTGILSVPITGLDMVGLQSILGGGGATAKKGVAKWLLDRAVGAAGEGVTEMGQEAIQGGATSYATGKPVLSLENLDRILTAGAGGALVGGALAQGEPSQAQPQPVVQPLVRGKRVSTLAPGFEEMPPTVPEPPQTLPETWQGSSLADLPVLRSPEEVRLDMLRAEGVPDIAGDTPEGRAAVAEEMARKQAEADAALLERVWAEREAKATKPPDVWTGEPLSLGDIPPKTETDVRMDILGAAGRPNVFGEILDSAKKREPAPNVPVDVAGPAPGGGFPRGQRTTVPPAQAPNVPIDARGPALVPDGAVPGYPRGARNVVPGDEGGTPTPASQTLGRVLQAVEDKSKPKEEKLVQDRKAPKGLIELPTDAIQESGLRRQAEDEARAAAIAGREVKADGPLAPYRAQMDDLRAKLKSNYDTGRRNLSNLRFLDDSVRYVAEVGDGVHVRDLDPDHPNQVIRIYQIHNGEIVGFADGIEGKTTMIAGGEPVGSPVSARPLYTKMRELLEPDDTLTLAGELARRRELDRLARKETDGRGDSQAVGTDRGGPEGTGQPGERVGEGPDTPLPASVGPSGVSPEPAVTEQEAPGVDASIRAGVPAVQAEPEGRGRGVEAATAEELAPRQYTDEERLVLLNYYSEQLKRGALEQGGMTRDPNERANRYGVDPIQARWGTVSRVLPGLEDEEVSPAEINATRNRIKRGTATPADIAWIDSRLEEAERRDAEAGQRLAESFDPTNIEELPDREMTPEEAAEAEKYAIARPGQRGLPGIGEDVAPTAAKPKGPQQTSMFGGEMLQGVEAKTTEGRESEGPLFTQEAEARAKKEREAQGGLFGEKERLAIGELVEKNRAGLRERVSKVFPGVKIEETPEGFSFNLKNGGRVVINQKGEIELRPMAAVAGYGKNVIAEVASGKKRVLGATRSFGPDIVVDIVDKGILPHESLHVFMDYFATEKEQGLIRAEFEKLAEKEGRSWHETAADGYQHWFYDRWFDGKAPSSTVAKFFRNIREFFKRMYRALFPNHESVFETIRSGEYLERERGDRSQFRYAVSGGRLTIPDEVWQDKVLRRVQDKMLRLKRMEEAVGKQGGTVSEQGKTYRAETLFHGRSEERIREVEKDYVDPLIDKMNRLKVTPEELDDYMQVLHEKDRDVLIAKRGGGPKGSGLSPAESAQIWRELSAKHGAIQNETIPKLEQLAKTVRQMREETLRVKVDGGLLTQEEADGWKDTFGPNYIPLKGTDSVGEMPAATGAGYSVKGRESRSATGRSTKAKTPVAYLIRDLESSIIRAEKNRVGQTFYKFVQDNPDLEWEIDKEHKWPENKKGKIVMVPDMAAYQNDFHVKVNGVDHRITVKDELVRKAMKNLDPEQLGVVMKVLSTANRYFSIMQTTANPGFLVDNFVRDYTAGISNTSAEQGKTIAKKVALSTPEAIRGIWQHARGKATTNPWAGWAKRFARAGGQTGFYDMKSVEDIAKSIENKLKATGSSPAAVARRVSGSVVRLVSDANKAVENGIRLAAFRAMVEAGHNEAEAASVAKSLTVNFNRKGELGPAMNALYAFSNASVQGSKRLVDVAVNNKTGRKIALGFVGAGFVMDTLARALAGDDDDDGINDYDQIPEFVKERNLIIPGTKATMKLPYGFNVLFSAGRNMSAVAHKAKAGGKATTDTLKTFLSVMNPLGSEASLLQFLSPTMTDPLVQLGENKSFGGQPVYPERRKGDFRPESKMAFKTVSPMAKAVAEGASKLTGGDDVKGGWIDVSPEVLEHLSSFVTGGLGRFVGQVATTGTSVAKGETPEPSKTPFVRSLIYSPHASEQSRRFYEYSDELEKLASNRKDYIEAGKKEKAKELAGGVLKVKGVFDSADRELKRLRTVRDRAEKQKRDTKMIEASIEAQYKRANKAMAEMRKRLGLPAVK